MKDIDNIKTQDLKKAIVETVAYFDMFDFPLTDFEIWQSAKEKCRLPDIRLLLQSADAGKFISEKNGFYFLPGRDGLVEIRLRRYNFFDRKMKRIIRVSKLFRLLPWIKMVALGNVMGSHNLRDGSDIDLFIITADKKIWTSRFFCASLMQIFGLRPKPNQARDKICLNFYATESRLNMKDLMFGPEDIYFVYWIANLIPVYNQGKTYEKFINANSFIKDILPNWLANDPVNRRKTFSPAGLIMQLMAVPFQLIGEKNLKKIQIRLMPDKLKQSANQNTEVVINDNLLKMHANDRRGYYYNKWQEKLKGINF